MAGLNGVIKIWIGSCRLLGICWGGERVWGEEVKGSSEFGRCWGVGLIRVG